NGGCRRHPSRAAQPRGAPPLAEPATAQAPGPQGNRVNQSKTRASPLDPTKGRCPLEAFTCVWGEGGGTGAGLGGRPARPRSPLPHPKHNGWIPKAPPLVGVQGAKPPGGFQGGALTLLWFIRLPPAKIES